MCIDITRRLQMDRLEAEARGFGLDLAEVNAEKPWGGYLRFTQASLGAFLGAYWSGVAMKPPADDESVDPKLLLVAPNAMLSLQWHKRRAERWRVIDGPVEIVTGTGWSDLKRQTYEAGAVIVMPNGGWHRLVGLEGWGRVAEIWEHMLPDDPSSEDDVFRVHDTYKRSDIEADPSTPIDQRDAKWQETDTRLRRQADH